MPRGDTPPRRSRSRRCCATWRRCTRPPSAPRRRGQSWHNEGVWRRLVHQVRALLLTDDPPWRIALAVAAGVFISCTPTFGFQTLIAFVVAYVARLNRA